MVDKVSDLKEFYNSEVPKVKTKENLLFSLPA